MHLSELVAIHMTPSMPEAPRSAAKDRILSAPNISPLRVKLKAPVATKFPLLRAVTTSPALKLNALVTVLTPETERLAVRLERLVPEGVFSRADDSDSQVVSPGAVTPKRSWSEGWPTVPRFWPIIVKRVAPVAGPLTPVITVTREEVCTRRGRSADIEVE